MTVEIIWVRCPECGSVFPTVDVGDERNCVDCQAHLWTFQNVVGEGKGYALDRFEALSRSAMDCPRRGLIERLHRLERLIAEVAG